MQSARSLAGWLAELETRHPDAIELGLDRVGLAWQRLGRPLPAPRIITVGGTNGKGSTVAYLAGLLEAAGFRGGTYTSPHLLEFTERVQVLSRPLAEDAWVAAFEEVDCSARGIRLTYFEFTTLAAFLLLSRAGLDYAVLEVGLGGRLDAVNLVDPDCAVITTVDLDHQEYLGTTREAIGREKAGIIRARRPVVLGEPDPPLSVLEIARRQAAPVYRLGREFRMGCTPGGCHWTMQGLGLDLPLPLMPGAHQAGNLATALAVLACLEPQALNRASDLAAAVRLVRIPGRLQPVASEPRVLLDVGHNPHAARAVAAALRARQLPPVSCVLGMLRDKDAAAVARELDPVIGQWHCAGLAGARGRSGEDLARDVASAIRSAPVTAHEEVAGALHAALAESSAAPPILVFGSFLTVAEAARWFARSLPAPG